MPFDRFIDFLNQSTNYEKTGNVQYSPREFKLDRMAALLNALGNPQQAGKAIHIAGSKGKGSTAQITAKLLEALGYRVGLYLSPHLLDLRERISVNGKWIDEGDLNRLGLEVQRAAAGLSEVPTFFESLTALAQIHFREEKTDFDVLEVGLGGRLDATNICNPIVCAITSIGFEHTHLLGDTLGKIAAEKAGILKPGVPAACGDLGDEAWLSVQQTALQSKAPLFKYGADFQLHENAKGSLCFASDGSEFDGIRHSLFGEHQNINMALAFWLLSRSVPPALIQQKKTAILQTVEKLNIPGRIQLLQHAPYLQVLDCAHTPESLRAFSETLLGEFRQKHPWEKLVLVFGLAKDKNLEECLKGLAPLASSSREKPLFIATGYESDRSREPGEILQALQFIAPNFETDQSKTCALALEKAEKLGGPNVLIAATGSLYLAGEMLKLLQKKTVPAGQ